MKKLSLASSLLCATLFAQEHNATLEGYLSELKEEQFALEQRNIDAQSATLRDSWIQPIRLSYTHMKSDPYGSDQINKNAVITLDQPIFKSGGIYFAVKFAEASHQNATDSLEQQRRMLIKQAVTLLMQLRQTELMIQKQELTIANAGINLEQKRELYMNGQIDSGFLNSAMIESNGATQALYELQNAKERLLSSFKSISDLDPATAPLPRLELIEQGDFLARNIDIKALESARERERYNKAVTVAKYLPQLNLVAGYNREISKGVIFQGLGTVPPTREEYYNYGFKLSMPLDINSISDTESARVTYLKSQVVLDDKKRELRALYEQVAQNIKHHDRKIALAHSNSELYMELLKETRDLYEAGYKTEFDVQNLENSVAIQKLDTQIYEIDKQIELLNLYEKIAP